MPLIIEVWLSLCPWKDQCDHEYTFTFILKSVYKCQLVYLLWQTLICHIRFSSVIKCKCVICSSKLLYSHINTTWLHVFQSSVALSIKIQFSVCVSLIGESNSEIAPISSFGSSSVSVTVTPIEQQLILLLESLQSLQ